MAALFLRARRALLALVLALVGAASLPAFADIPRIEGEAGSFFMFGNYCQSIVSQTPADACRRCAEGPGLDNWGRTHWDVAFVGSDASGCNVSLAGVGENAGASYTIPTFYFQGNSATSACPEYSVVRGDACKCVFPFVEDASKTSCVPPASGSGSGTGEGGGSTDPGLSGVDQVQLGQVFSFGFGVVVMFWLIGLKFSVIVRPFWRRS